MRIFFLLLISLLLISNSVWAKEVHVRGYTRKDGTYVQPHIRSAPDSSRANNLGPSYGKNMNSPFGRDSDHDGIQNRFDTDDDNDGIGDNSDHTQYGR